MCVCVCARAIKESDLASNLNFILSEEFIKRC